MLESQCRTETRSHPSHSRKSSGRKSWATQTSALGGNKKPKKRESRETSTRSGQQGRFPNPKQLLRQGKSRVRSYDNSIAKAGLGVLWKLDFTRGRRIVTQEILRDRSICSFTPPAIVPELSSFTSRRNLSPCVGEKDRLFPTGTTRTRQSKPKGFFSTA